MARNRPLTGWWPSADAVARVTAPVVMTDGGLPEQIVEDAPDEDPNVEVKRNQYGSACADVDRGAPVWSALALSGADDDATDVSVTGYWYDEGMPPRVELEAAQQAGSLTLTMSPARASELAAELRTAAAHVEVGDADE